MILLVLVLSRVSLYVFNFQLFSGFTTSDIAWAIFVGLRFDLSVLFMLSALFIIGNTIPMPFRSAKVFQAIIKVPTLIALTLAIFLNLSDAIYYRFTLKRMTFDIFSYLSSMETFWEVAPRFLVDFWYAFLMAIVLLVFLVFSFNGVRVKVNRNPWSIKTFILQTVIFIVSMGIVIIGIRGGFQLKPINIVDASLHAPARLSPVVLNTPFTIIKSVGQTGLELKSDFTEVELEKNYQPVQSYPPLDSVPEPIKNVVVLILESFSSEHIGYLSHQKSFTPFLDSLFEHSLVFSGIANGKRSIEGIPAILSALPTLSDESFLNSPYAGNQIEGLAHSLNHYNYQTAFFHGGNNGTMSFDAYASAAGFQEYYGKNEYPNPEDYDGHWGIWDEKYLQYFTEELTEFKEPFLAALFTLSSHHPYQIPAEYTGKFPKGKLQIQQAIAYSDFALKQFFTSAKTKDWYQNTLFVITADHTSEGAEAAYQNSLGQFSIPIAFFAPGDTLMTRRSKKKLVQQTDIYPSILHYLGMQDSIIAFGNSIFEGSSRIFAVNYFNGNLQMMDEEYLLQMEDGNPKSLYEYRKDSLLKNNVLNKRDINDLVTFEKAFQQQYNNRMIQNQIRIKNHE
ncbi:LTA synthase family protein [Lentimicrobium sp. S6]|uniref:LTA synthase family protein n=1 Tax=Lentimicrobium sp. S6 TaxID=2735872 RepID=UPI0015520C16|nr:LTA synthase family protein [Lentimicrobium sp. S6]NPD46207.1 sulfatase-like hydrolase/transferase [Lentimicrobium sp. S6]